MNYTGPSEFVHLHVHSNYSFLDGVGTPQQYAKRCHEMKYPAMAATEHGHMASVPDMATSFKKYGIKNIAGCEIYFNDFELLRQDLVGKGIKIRSPDWRAQNPELASRITRNRHLTVLCKDEVGFSNLVKLTTQAYETGLFGMGRSQYNRIWFDKLCEYKEGLIVLSGCLNGPVCHELRFKELADKEGNIIFERSKEKRLSDAIKWVKKFKEVFKDDFYVETQMPGIPDDDKVFRWLISIADQYKVKLALTTDTHYLDRKDFILQKIMMAVDQDLIVDSPDLFHVNSDEQYLKSRAELWSTFKGGGYCRGVSDSVFEDMCNNTLLIADKCKAFVADPSPKIPEIDDADAKLKRLVALGLRERGLDKVDKKYVVDGVEVSYVEQAKIELNRFIDKGYSSYFLITSDLINHGKEMGWPFSPRGSAAGSLVCYLLGISSIDPLKWGLSFDRFLSSSRGGYLLNVSME